LTDPSNSTKYGLPETVLFCKRCVISNQRPNSTREYAHLPNSKKETIHFEDGICDACRVAEAKASTNWEERERELRDLCDRHRSKDGDFDCIVPGSGGKVVYCRQCCQLIRTRILGDAMKNGELPQKPIRQPP